MEYKGIRRNTQKYEGIQRNTQEYEGMRRKLTRTWMGAFCLSGWLSAAGGALVSGMVCEHTTETYANRTRTTLESKEYEGIIRNTEEYEGIRKTTKDMRIYNKNVCEHGRTKIGIEGIRRSTKDYEGTRRNEYKGIRRNAKE